MDGSFLSADSQQTLQLVKVYVNLISVMMIGAPRISSTCSRGGLLAREEVYSIRSCCHSITLASLA